MFQTELALQNIQFIAGVANVSNNATDKTIISLVLELSSCCTTLVFLYS